MEGGKLDPIHDYRMDFLKKVRVILPILTLTKVTVQATTCNSKNVGLIASGKLISTCQRNP